MFVECCFYEIQIITGRQNAHSNTVKTGLCPRTVVRKFCTKNANHRPLDIRGSDYKRGGGNNEQVYHKLHTRLAKSNASRMLSPSLIKVLRCSKSMANYSSLSRTVPTGVQSV